MLDRIPKPEAASDACKDKNPATYNVPTLSHETKRPDEDKEKKVKPSCVRRGDAIRESPFFIGAPRGRLGRNSGRQLPSSPTTLCVSPRTGQSGSCKDRLILAGSGNEAPLVEAAPNKVLLFGRNTRPP